MAFAFAVLRLSPGAFWTMTLRELAAAIDGLSPRRRQPPRRRELDRLMRRFPD